MLTNITLRALARNLNGFAISRSLHLVARDLTPRPHKVASSLWGWRTLTTTRVTKLPVKSDASAAAKSKSAPRSKPKPKPKATTSKAKTATASKKSKPKAAAKAKKPLRLSKPKITKKPATKSAPKKAVKKQTKTQKPELLFTPPPKRPLAPYFIFLVERSLTQRPKADVAQEWANLPQSEKDVYTQRRQDQWLSYKEACAEWEKSQSPEGLAQYTKLRRARKRSALMKKAEKGGFQGLRGPTMPFFALLREVRNDPAKFGLQEAFEEKFPSNVTLTRSEKFAMSAWTAKQAGAVWRDMSLGQKAAYIAQYQEKRASYEQEKAALIAKKLAETAKAVEHPRKKS